MIFENNYVEEKTINDAWRSVMWMCVRNGYDYVVEHGSYIGQIRRQLENVCVKITEPWVRPLAPFLPEGSNYSLTSDEKIRKYFNDYLIGSEKSENEDYTYGEFIAPQLYEAVYILKVSNGNSNQACITIGDPTSIFLKDPPCLRTLTFKIVKGKLNMSVFFRSWDLFCGFPENIGGLQLLKEEVLEFLNYAGLDIEDGSIFAYSDGLHLYEQYFSLVNTLCVDKIELPVKEDKFN